MKVLLVDDHEITLRLQAGLFRDDGWEVHTCDDAGKAPAANSELHPDLVVLDLSMPGHDGLEVLVEMRRQHRCHVLVLSGFSKEKLEAIVLELGASAYLEKGTRSAQILRMAKAILEEEVPPLTKKEKWDIRLIELV